MSEHELSQAFIAAQRQRLLAIRSELLGGEASTLARERRLEEENGAEAKEYEDDAQKMEQDIANQALRDVNAHRITDVERALQKIDDGTYGLSDESGDPIPIERLEVLPEAILTVQEQSQRDTRK